MPTVLDSEEETRFLATIPLDDLLPFSVYRKRVFLHLLLFTGLRVSEALSLSLAQVRLEADPPVVRVIGKGNKEREVPISPTLQVVLEGYLERRRRFVRIGNWLFSTAVGAPLTRTWAYTTVSEAIRGAGIQKPAYGPHVLRHTFATRQLRAGIAPAIVKAWLGHEDLAITFRVYEHVIAAPAGVRPV
ncbi:tyrosine-type recombinase/integrase [Acidithiobacillus caldus]